MLSVIEQFTSGTLTEGQAINIIATSIGVSTEEAKNILNGVVKKNTEAINGQ
ncbi:MAG: hypothetical protein KHZ87_06680 [Clostridiales bacterium]|nr:hypothetical protein [Clostridiales bacterium]MBS5877011.1 hypothetical protein [Clostridiales bacterium]MDU0940083.1 hypothetical protein [Clostridiales bacterium]MDU1041721.1 hypothetical protein [Clostridiales bacterium]MDU3490337.1 hypothetical protein [Clostridiales bacterium]